MSFLIVGLFWDSFDEVVKAKRSDDAEIQFEAKSEELISNYKSLE